MALICGKLCTDSRMGTPVEFKQLILQFPVRPPAFTLKETSPSLCCLFPIAKVYHVFFVRSQGKRVEPCRCSFIRAKPSSASEDPKDLVAPWSISAIQFPGLLSCEHARFCVNDHGKLAVRRVSCRFSFLLPEISLAFPDTVKPSVDRCR